jgi:hypothetical protein
MTPLEASQVQVVTVPVPHSRDGPMQLTMERLRAVDVTQDDFQRGTGGIVRERAD